MPFLGCFSGCSQSINGTFPAEYTCMWLPFSLLLGSFSRRIYLLVVCSSRVSKTGLLSKMDLLRVYFSFRLYFIDCPRPLSIIGPAIAVYMACREGGQARISQYQAWPCPVCWRLFSVAINGGGCARPGPLPPMCPLLSVQVQHKSLRISRGEGKGNHPGPRFFCG